MFFDGIDDLAESFNGAVMAGAHSAAQLGMVATIFALADTGEKKKQDELTPLRAAAKMSLFGMLL